MRSMLLREAVTMRRESPHVDNETPVAASRPETVGGKGSSPVE